MVVRSLASITQAPARTAEPNQKTPVVVSGNISDGSGNQAPTTGASLPSERPVDAANIAEAAARLSEVARESGRHLEFRVDDTSGRTVITVTNATTGEVVRQIPSEEVLALARQVESSSVLVDSEV